MAYTNVAATGQIPIFGISASFTVSSVAQDWWHITDLQVSNTGPVIEQADSTGMTRARTYYNNDGSNKSYDRTLTMTLSAKSTDEATARTKNIPYARGTVIVVTSASHPDAAGSWEVQDMSGVGTNTGYATYSVSAKWGVANS